MKFIKSLKFKLPIFIGIPVVSATLALVFGLVDFSNDNLNNKKAPSPESYGESYFDNRIINSPNNDLENDIIFPHGGKNLFPDLIIIDESKFSKRSNIFSIIEFSSSEKKALWSTVFDLSKQGSYVDVKAKFKEVNQQIFDFVHDRKNADLLKNHRLGIYWYAESFWTTNSDNENSYIRRINVEIYQLKEDSKRSKIANKFADDLDNFQEQAKDIDFLNLVTSSMLLTKNSIAKVMGFAKVNKIGANNIAYVSTKGGLKTKINVEGVGKIEFSSFIKNKNNPFVFFPKQLLDNQMVATFTPIINIDEAQVDWVIDFYVLNQQSVVKKPKTAEYVVNPSNIIRVIKHTKISTLLSNSENDNTQSAPITNNPGNQELITSKLINEWVDFWKKPFVPGALSILNTEIPTMSNHVSYFTETLRALTNIKNLSNGDKLIQKIFDPDTNNKNLTEKIIDKLNEHAGSNNKKRLLQPQLFFELAFKNVNGIKPTSHWSNFQSFTSITGDKNESMNKGEKSSSLRNLYTLIMGFNILGKEVEKRIYELIESGDIANNPYNHIELNPVINQLFNLLVENGIIAKDKKINDVLTNIAEFVNVIFDRARNNKAFPLEAKYIKFILSFLQINPNSSDEDLDKAADIIGSIFKNKNNVLSLLRLFLDDNANLLDIFQNIENNIGTLLKIVGKNIDENKSILTLIGRAISQKQLLKFMLPQQSSGINISFIVEKMILGIKNQDNLNEFVKGMPSIIPSVINSNNTFDENINIINTLLLGKSTDKRKSLMAKVFKSGLTSLNMSQVKEFVDTLLDDVFASGSLIKSLLNDPEVDKIVSDIKMSPENRTTIAKVLFYLSR